MARETQPGIGQWRQIIGPWRRFRRLLTPNAYAAGFLASSVMAVLIVIAMVVLGEYTKTRGRFLLTAVVFGSYFLFTLGPVWAARRRPSLAVPQVALVFGGAALLLILTGIWATPNSDGFWKSAAIVTALAVTLAYLAVVDLEPGRLRRSFAVKVISFAAFMVSLGIAAGINWPPYWWVFTLAMMVWAAALLAVPARYLVRRIQGR